MGKLMARAGLVAGLAAVAVLVYAQRRSAETGKDVGTVLTNLPAELNQSAAVWRRRLRQAVDVGKQAAARRETEIDQELSKVDVEAAAPPDFIT